MAETYSINAHFVNKDAIVRALCHQLVAPLRTFGLLEEDPKKTFLPLNRKSALAGVETRQDDSLLNIKYVLSEQAQSLIKT